MTSLKHVLLHLPSFIHPWTQWLPRLYPTHLNLRAFNLAVLSAWLCFSPQNLHCWFSSFLQIFIQNSSSQWEHFGHPIYYCNTAIDQMFVSLPIRMSKPNSPCVWRRALWEVIRSSRWSPSNLDCCPYKRDSKELPHPFYNGRTQGEASCLWTR